MGSIDIEFTGFDVIDDWRGCAIATIIGEKGKKLGKLIVSSKPTVLKQGQIWRDVAESKLGMKYFSRSIDDSDFEIVDVDVWPNSRNPNRKQRTRVRRLFGTRTSIKDTRTINPPRFVLIKDVE